MTSLPTSEELIPENLTAPALLELWPKKWFLAVLAGNPPQSDEDWLVALHGTVMGRSRAIHQHGHSAAPALLGRQPRQRRLASLAPKRTRGLREAE